MKPLIMNEVPFIIGITQKMIIKEDSNQAFLPPGKDMKGMIIKENQIKLLKYVVIIRPST